MKKTTKQFRLSLAAVSFLFCLLAGINYSHAQCYLDADNDGYGYGATMACAPGTVTNNLDCDDNCYACNPGAPEILDGIDNDCNSLTDEGFMTVNSGTDETSYFGYAPDQDITRTAVVSNGYPPFTFSWTMNRALICNFYNSAGDELFSGGTCTNNICPGTGSLVNSPACNGATLNTRLLANAIICVMVTDAQGSTATDCFSVSADDARCFTGNTQKITMCHRTGSNSNTWVEICVSNNAVNTHLGNGDYVGHCTARQGISGTSSSFAFDIFPNPSSGMFTIGYRSYAHSPLEIQVANIYGQVIYRETANNFNGEFSKQLNLNFLSSGVYMVRVSDGTNLESRRIVIEK